MTHFETGFRTSSARQRVSSDETRSGALTPWRFRFRFAREAGAQPTMLPVDADSADLEVLTQRLPDH